MFSNHWLAANYQLIVVGVIHWLQNVSNLVQGLKLASEKIIVLDYSNVAVNRIFQWPSVIS